MANEYNIKNGLKVEGDIYNQYGKIGNAPVNVTFFKTSANGVVPLTEFS